MDITPQDSATQPISDDQDLAKALAGVMPDAPVPADLSGVPGNGLGGFQYEQAPGISGGAMPTPMSSQAPAPAPDPAQADQGDRPGDMGSRQDSEQLSGISSDLNDIKNSALNELRPLIGKVDLPAEEKFDTYLMLIRSTDDTSLIEPAHAAAQNISDEKRKAEALLDIIKEIDYLSRKDS